MRAKQPRTEFYFVGERLCLDFVNTEVVERGSPIDLLKSFDDLVAWSLAAEIIDAVQAKKFVDDWSNRRQAENAFALAKKFRASLRDMAERLVRGKPVSESAIAIINELLRERVGYDEMVRVRGGYEKRLHRSFGEPVHLIVPVAESASDLLTADDLTLVRRCENPQCILYFYDTTKNHARRWCSMSACGNRSKAAAHYQRKREKRRLAGSTNRRG